MLSSEFCRVLTTAALLDLGPTIEQRQDLTFFVSDEASRCQSTQFLLAEPPAAGTNTAIVAHGPSTACGILHTLAMGEAAIFKPDGRGGATFVTRVLPNAWRR